MPMRKMNTGDGESVVGETGALDDKSNRLGLGGKTLDSELGDRRGTAESSSGGIRADFDGIGRDGNGDLQPSTSECGLSGSAINPVLCDGRGNGEVSDEVETGSNRNSRDPDMVVAETVIVIDSEGNTSSNRNDEVAEVKESELQPCDVIVDKSKTKVIQVEKPSHVIDMKCGGRIEGLKDFCEGERVCRICHLSSEGTLECATSTTAAAVPINLIQLGCGCKDELGISHSHCAEAWFKLRGNRMCEICGETAKNVSGIVDNRFMQEWNERRFMGIGSRSSDRGGGCWRGQPFCNFLMACLVIAFVLPWFFRVNLF